MSRPVPLFVELCAGLAAVSVRLQGGRHARPPVSRMGNKAGYATAILAAMGLRPGQGAERFLWCEPDPGCRALLTAYTDPALMREAAAIIRGWKDEDPRALWERLRAEGPIREATGAEVARFLNVEAWTQGGRYMGPDRPSSCHPPGWVASITSLGFARRVESHEVARWLVVTGWTRGNGGLCVAPGACPEGTNPAVTLDGMADRMASLPARHGPVALSAVEPDTIPPGTVVYIDPPYVGTTGYGCDLPRAEVVRLARMWSEAGALVVISEAEPIEALSGWHVVEITGERRGQKRTFSRQQREWLTMNREPAVRPMVQASLFGDAA